MDDQSVDSFKNLCEEWLMQCIICHRCGKLPETLWKCGCDHLFCDACKFIKKCDVCSFPFSRRTKRNRGPIRESIYDNLIEAAHELVELLSIDVSSLVQSKKDLSEHEEFRNNSKVVRGRNESVSPEKKKSGRSKSQSPQKERNVSDKRNNVDEKSKENELRNESENNAMKIDEEDEKPEGRFGKRKYVRKQSAVESLKTPRSKSENLFEKVVASEGKRKRNETNTKSTTTVDVASSEEDSVEEVPVKEVPKLRRRQPPVTQKSTSKSVSLKVPKESQPVKGRRGKRTASVIDETSNPIETRKSRRSMTPSPKKQKLNTRNKTAKMEETICDFKSDVEVEKKVKLESEMRGKGDTTCDSLKNDNKDILASSRQKSARLRARSTSTVNSESLKSRNSSPKNSIVLVATSLSKDQMSELYRFRKIFHCKVKETYDNDVTHVICRTVEDNYTSRTIKYLHGLVGNKWLLSYDWINDSIREGEILDEELYEVRGTCKDKEASNGAPKKSRTTKKKLFKDYTAYFEGKFVPQNIPPKNDLIKLFKSAGGNVIDTSYKLNTVIKKEQKLLIIREDNQEASATTGSLISINVADFLSMITEFNVKDDSVNFA